MLNKLNLHNARLQELLASGKKVEALVQAHEIKLAAEELITSIRDSISDDEIAEAYDSGVLGTDERFARAVGVSTDKSPIKVARWDAYELDQVELALSHEMVITDQRRQNGQVYIDINQLVEPGITDYQANPSVTIEIQNLAEMMEREGFVISIDHDINVPVIHMHFDNSELAASFFHQKLENGRSRFIIRPETGVVVRQIAGGLMEIISTN